MEVNGEQVAGMVLPPLYPVVKNAKYMYDSTQIVLKCKRNHTDVYPHSAIISSNGKLQCRTCAAGTKFSNMARALVEALFGAGFILCRDVTNNRCVEYHSQQHKLRILCSRDHGADIAYMVGNCLFVEIHPTNSVNVLRTKINTILAPHCDHFCQTVSDALKSPASPAMSPALSPASPASPQSPAVKAQKYTKAKLPYTEALAKSQSDTSKRLGGQERLELNIIQATLCLENCILR
jgi:hypothetical protein